MTQLESRGFTRDLSVHVKYTLWHKHRKATHIHVRTERAKKPVTRHHSLVLIAIFRFKAVNNDVSQLQASLF